MAVFGEVAVFVAEQFGLVGLTLPLAKSSNTSTLLSSLICADHHRDLCLAGVLLGRLGCDFRC